MIKARASGSKVYLYFMKKGRQARHRIPRNSCFSRALSANEAIGKHQKAEQQIIFLVIEYFTVELQWLKSCWPVYHGCFELVLESLGKAHSCRSRMIKGDFLFYNENGILCVLIRIASIRRF